MTELKHSQLSANDVTQAAPSEPACASARFEASWPGAQAAERWLIEACDQLAIEQTTAYAIQACSEELFTNAIRHGIEPLPGEADPTLSTWFELQIAKTDAGALLQFTDNGVAFDAAKAVHEASRPKESHAIGGLGLVLLKGLAQSIRYERCNEHNVTSLDFVTSVSNKS